MSKRVVLVETPQGLREVGAEREQLVYHLPDAGWMPVREGSPAAEKLDCQYATVLTLDNPERG